MGTYRPEAFIFQCDGLRKNAAAATDLAETQPRAATLCPRSGVAAERNYPTSEVRGSGWEEVPHIQGVVAAWAQEGLEALPHIEGQEGRR